jgi:hypothetical protein
VRRNRLQAAMFEIEEHEPKTKAIRDKKGPAMKKLNGMST